MVNLVGINRYFYLKGYGCFKYIAFFLLKLGNVSQMENTQLNYIEKGLFCSRYCFIIVFIIVISLSFKVL